MVSLNELVVKTDRARNIIRGIHEMTRPGELWDLFAGGARARLLLPGAAAYLYLNLFAFPHTPFLLSGDQLYFWMDAERMLDGGRIYRDFFQFTPPGTDLIYLALFKMFGLSLWVTNALVLCLGIGLSGLCFALASEIMRRRYAVLAAALFIVIIYGKLLNATHHWFSVFSALAAIKIGMGKTASAQTVLAGSLLGVASFFTQTHGAAALLAFVIFTVWRQSRAKQSWLSVLKNEGVLLLGYAALFLLLNAHLLASIGWRGLWYFQVTYVQRYVVPVEPGGFLGLPGPLAWRTLPKLSQYLLVYLLLAIVYPLALWRCWRERRNPYFPWERVALLSTVGSVLLVEVAFNLNWLRLYAVSMPGLILLVWFFGRVPNMRRYAVGAMWAGVCCLAVLQTVSAHKYQTRTMHLPAGQIVTSSQMYEKLNWLKLHTKPGQCFFQAAWPGVYLPLQLRNPVFVDQIMPGRGTRPGEIAMTIRQLDERRAPFVLWASRLDSPDRPLRQANDQLQPLREYLRVKYDQVHVFADGDQLWQRQEFDPYAKCGEPAGTLTKQTFFQN